MNKQLLILSILFSALFINTTAQTLEKLTEISTGFGSSNPYNFTVVGNKLFFVAKDDGNIYRLYVTDGTAANTQLVSPSSILNGTIYSMIAYNGKLFFTANDGINGQELWTSDGTPAGTVLFKDLYAGATGSFPEAFTVANGKLFFLGNSVSGDSRLYISDGTTAGTFIIRNNGTQLFNGFSDFAVFNNEIYFRGDGGVLFPYGMWKSDGTIAGTVMVKAGGMSPGVFGGNYAVLNNKMYFSGYDDNYGGELWVTDGTELGTHIVKNLSADGGGIIGNGAPFALTVYNSKIYFCARDDVHGTELFVTDGTEPGTTLVKDIVPGTESGTPGNITVFNGLLYMFCGGLQELWKSDGTEAGTQTIKQVLQLTRFGATWNNKMYLISGNNQYLWESDGTAAGTGYATATNTNAAIRIFATDQKMTEFNASLYFGGSSDVISPSTEPLKYVAATVIHNFSFTGSGNWSNPANWAGGIVPPATLMAGDHVVINGNCILDITQQAMTGSTITVAAGKTLVIAGSLTLT